LLISTPGSASSHNYPNVTFTSCQWSEIANNYFYDERRISHHAHTKTMTPTKAPTLLTAAGRITCLRCIATPKLTTQQFGRPALKTCATQKCQFHGGRSTGPKSGEGRQRITNAHHRHGESSKASRQAYSKSSTNLRRLEEAMYVLGMTSAPHTRGRKPLGYAPVCTMRDVHEMILGMELHRNTGSNEGI
jgi:hypothetical protein